uniref:Vitelline membrane outer layer protein 1 homolog n=1 Tax=Laticauda laticaudata TaxID=8630 RepID=A0A8C5SCN3_LATLA
NLCVQGQSLLHTTLLLTISCCLWNTEAQNYKYVLTIPNGGPWGAWGSSEFCPEGYLVSFSLRVEPPQGKERNKCGGRNLKHCKD